MRIKFTSYLVVVVIFLSNSCLTYINIPATTSPSIKLDEQAHRIAFINRYDYTVLPNQNMNENKNEVLEKGARQVIYNLEKSFAEDSWLELVLADTLARGRALNNFPELLIPGFVVSTCKLHDVDLLLLFDFFDASFSSETETIENDDGSRSNTNYVDLIVEAGFSLYKSDGVLIDRRKETETIAYQARPALTRWIFIGPSMKKAGDKVSELAAKLGYNYINNFYPGFKSVPRLVYAGSDFSKVTQLMKQQQWDEAIELLMPLANSPDQKLAKRAAHNLSLCLRAAGRVSDAVYWMNKANEK
jgi:hypothetical protein